MSSDNYPADQVGPIPAEHWKESIVKLEVGTDLLKQSNTQTLGSTEGAQKCWGTALGLGAPEALLPSLAPPGAVFALSFRINFPYFLFIVAQPKHLIKLGFWLFASSIRAQVEVVRLWVPLAPAIPG